MNPKQLEGLAMQALNLAKTDMQFKRWNSFLLASYDNGGQLQRMRSVERIIENKLGEDWLNHGETKDWGFGLLRACVKLAPPDAVVIVTGVNKFTPTDKFLAAPPEIKRKYLDGGHDTQHEGVRDGYLEIHDALAASAQNAEMVCMAIQLLLRPGVFTGPPEINLFPQVGFDGRMKMYGEGKHCVDLDLDDLVRKQ